MGEEGSSAAARAGVNYGGVYVGLPSDAAAMVSSQTKATPKGIGRLRFAFLLLPQFNFIY
uniref:Overexpressed in colon carcinoma 1 n=1 Tax=Aquila chrysaetos chrysaetos TaxID=223781 RepID=A0A663EF00_AQUCH